jgi:hypothetical protein
MSNYCVTFRLANRTINGKSYDDRRAMLIDNCREDKGYWDEPTSFILVESNLNTDAFAAKACRGLSSEDLVFIFDPSDMSASYFGAVDEVNVLRSFFPKLRKVA